MINADIIDLRMLILLIFDCGTLTAQEDSTKLINFVKKFTWFRISILV